MIRLPRIDDVIDDALRPESLRARVPDAPKIDEVVWSHMVDSTGTEALRVYMIVGDRTPTARLGPHMRSSLGLAVLDELQARGVDLYAYTAVVKRRDYIEKMTPLPNDEGDVEDMEENPEADE